MKRLYLETVGMLLLACSTPALGQTYSTESPVKATQRALGEMNNAFSMGHPDLWFEYAGMQEYAKGSYRRAMRFFLKSAWYSDKPSQLSIGLMYLNGEGVDKDLVKAYAWTALAAERNYPDFVATRDHIWEQLDGSQRRYASSVERSLLAQYGDEIAKPREIDAMRLGWNDLFTFTHVVAANAEYEVIPMADSDTKCQSDGTLRGCLNIYAKWLWDPKRYFMMRDAAWNSTVTAGPSPYARSAPVIERSTGSTYEEIAI
jgi:uncharacterized protein